MIKFSVRTKCCLSHFSVLIDKHICNAYHFLFFSIWSCQYSVLRFGYVSDIGMWSTQVFSIILSLSMHLEGYISMFMFKETLDMGVRHKYFKKRKSRSSIARSYSPSWNAWACIIELTIRNFIWPLYPACCSHSISYVFIPLLLFWIYLMNITSSNAIFFILFLTIASMLLQFFIFREAPISGIHMEIYIGIWSSKNLQIHQKTYKKIMNIPFRLVLIFDAHIEIRIT